jgi:hypothetical protein
MASNVSYQTDEGTTLGKGVASAANEVKEKLGETAERVQQSAKSQLSDRKDQVADSMDNVASALRNTGEQLRGEDTSFVGDYVNKAADKVSSLSQHLRDNDLDGLLRETEDFARRQPALFLGGAFALGVITARFLKSSSERRYDSMSANRYQSYYTTNHTPYGRNDYDMQGQRGEHVKPKPEEW